MLERWFAQAPRRARGGREAGGRQARGRRFGRDAGVRNAARLLWETARREAEEVQRVALESAQRELQAREEALDATQAALGQREDAFEQARVSLDAALASSRLGAPEALDRQLKEARCRSAAGAKMGLENEVKRLTALLHSLLMSAERRGFRIRLGGRVCHIDSRFRHSAIGCTYGCRIFGRAYSGQYQYQCAGRTVCLPLRILHFKKINR